MTTPYLYTFFPAIDVQEGGQEGLAGGGVDEDSNRGDAVEPRGLDISLQHGVDHRPSRCASQFLSSYRVTITFLDPCGEISNNGGTLAIGGSYFSTLASTTVNGRSFRLALEGFVINNDSSVALNFLRQTGCFHNIELHELGHVLGLGHSLIRRRSCFRRSAPPVWRDRAGLPSMTSWVSGRFIPRRHHGIPGAGVPGPSKIMRATEAGEHAAPSSGRREWARAHGTPARLRRRCDG